MTAYLYPILFVIFLWWISTGIVLWLARGRDEQMPVRLLGLTVLAAMGFAAATISAHSQAGSAPYVGFAAALSVWAWIEFTFLTGMITGSRAKPCPEHAGTRQRFWLAFKAIDRHELLLVGAMLALALVTFSGIDQTALWTFATLWVMRISAKLTIFDGVPAFSHDMMPSKIAHLQSYFRVDRIGRVFWISTTVSSLVLVAVLVAFMMGAVPDSMLTTTLILTTLIALAAFEHWMMVLPIRDSALWQWASTN
ncbi:MAG: putative photosynthetic complex assembly protein PuhE [Pseudomonadota bacterium]